MDNNDKYEGFRHKLAEADDAAFRHIGQQLLSAVLWAPTTGEGKENNEALWKIYEEVKRAKELLNG